MAQAGALRHTIAGIEYRNVIVIPMPLRTVPTPRVAKRHLLDKYPGR